MRYHDLIEFWINEVGPKGWYQGSPELDQTIRDRFLGDWERAHAGKLASWSETAQGALGLLILTDQFSRNLFREDPSAFATDALARDVARTAIAGDLDLDIGLPERQFFYTPFMHSEDLADQDYAVTLYGDRMSEPRGQGDTLHARAHREIIRQYGRFPYRNGALSRTSTPQEMQFMSDGGYGKITKSLQGEK